MSTASPTESSQPRVQFFGSATELREHYGWEPSEVKPAPLLSRAEAVKRGHLTRKRLSGGATATRRARNIAAKIAAQHGFTFDEITGRGQYERIFAARVEAIVAVAEAHPLWSLNRIGQLFNRDHTTIINALRAAGIPSKRGSLTSAMLSLHDDGYGVEDISLKINRPCYQVRSMLKEALSRREQAA